MGRKLKEERGGERRAYIEGSGHKDQGIELSAR